MFLLILRNIYVKSLTKENVHIKSNKSDLGTVAIRFLDNTTSNIRHE